MKVDLETLKTLKEVFTHHHVGEVVPVHTQQKDTFSIFTGGLRDNWPFVLAVVGVSLWLINSNNEQKNINAFQDVQIKTNAEDIAALTVSISQVNTGLQTSNTNHLNSYNELIRKIDGLQAAIEALKSAQ